LISNFARFAYAPRSLGTTMKHIRCASTHTLVWPFLYDKTVTGKTLIFSRASSSASFSSCSALAVRVASASLHSAPPTSSDSPMYSFTLGYGDRNSPFIIHTTAFYFSLATFSGYARCSTVLLPCLIFLYVYFSYSLTSFDLLWITNLDLAHVVGFFALEVGIDSPFTSLLMFSFHFFLAYGWTWLVVTMPCSLA